MAAAAGVGSPAALQASPFFPTPAIQHPLLSVQWPTSLPCYCCCVAARLICDRRAEPAAARACVRRPTCTCSLVPDPLLFPRRRWARLRPSPRQAPCFVSHARAPLSHTRPSLVFSRAPPVASFHPSHPWLPRPDPSVASRRSRAVLGPFIPMPAPPARCPFLIPPHCPAPCRHTHESPPVAAPLTAPAALCPSHRASAPPTP